MTPARFLQDWLEGWNGHDLDVIMRHYAETNVVYWGAEEVASRLIAH